ncbi:MAG: tetratricopeptide repeat protein [Paludibacter sp.]|jgi:tetratricopeptide (TPR) repeat protein|nr:tetratricopeptide repeat protein [Paludibacter sp.]
MAKKVSTKHDELENVQHVLGTSEAFLEKYQKQITYGLVVVALIVLAIFAFRNWYIVPRSVEAQNEISKAQNYFAIDSFRVAVEGNLECIGFHEIVSDFGITPSGNLAAAYAGICYYKLGQYEDAVKYLSKYNGKSSYLGIEVIGLIGDCYIELGNTEKALSFFNKTIEKGNEVLSPIYLKKAASAYESLAKPTKALEMYKKIKDAYPSSSEASDIDKYISRLEK